MIINNNIPALNTYRQLGINQNAMTKSMEKLSSGLRINRAGDDAAGLAISEKMRAQIKGLDQASRNAQDGISMIQTAEGALQETQNILQRMRELAVQAANDTNVDVDREEIQKEINQLTSEINRIGNTTEFNTQKLLDGGNAGSTPVVSGASLSGGVDADGGDPAVAATGTVTFDADVLASVGTTISIDDAVYELYDSADGTYSGSNTGIDINGFSTNEEIIDAIVTADAGSNSTLTKGSATELVVTASSAGEAGNDIELSVAGGETGFSANFQIGANNGQSMTIEILDMRAEALGIAGSASGDHVAGTNEKAVAVTGAAFVADPSVTDGTTNNPEFHALDVSDHEKASAAVEVVNNAIEAVSAQRSELGAYQNRLEHTISNLDNSSENLSAAESRIRDVDMAKEMMEMTRANILSQASQSMLAQANQQPQSVLQLLG